MSIQIWKQQNTSTDTDMDIFRKNLRMHRLRNLCIGIGVLTAAVLCILGLQIALQHRTYEGYEVVRSFDRVDTMTTQYTEFLNYVLKYSKDGISCVDTNNKLVWSETYNMQNPMVDVCQGSVALADENGTQAMIFDESGLQSTLTTRLPIRQVVVSAQGVLAALLEDGDVMRLYLYNKSGEELVDSKFELQDVGYPLKMSISSDATKLAVTLLQIQGGVVNTCLAFYNFDSVGENYEDHLVSSAVISREVMPCVQYLDETHCFAVGSSQLLIYEGMQIPEPVATIPMEREIRSVFYSRDRIGLVVEGKELAHALQVYDTDGKLVFETEFDLDYRTLKFSGENILIYNEFSCMMLSSRGKVFFETDFEESISNLYTMSGKSYYIVMHASRTDQIHLR